MHLIGKEIESFAYFLDILLEFSKLPPLRCFIFSKA